MICTMVNFFRTNLSMSERNGIASPVLLTRLTNYFSASRMGMN